ncbi:MAG TPA: MBL fold metallo-hydrolase [Gammaproteobacteria bacterium]|nr:MBL fold metallo-hydrolase [Gammaproteobacteria bacterium]
MPRSLALACLLSLAIFAPAWAEAPGPFFTLHELGTGVWAAVTVPGSHAGGNSGFVVGDDGVLVIDSFQIPEAATALLAAIRQKTGLPVRYVVDTHYHLDHVAGNGVYAQVGAVVMAQENVRAWERTENLKFFGDKITPEQKQMVQSLVLPSLTYKDGVTLHLGARTVEVRVFPGHTGGDSVVIVPDADVVFTGDLFWDHNLPNLIDADTARQIASNDAFLKDYPDATFVPGHGEVGHAVEVKAFRDYLVALRQAVADARNAGKSGQALMGAVLPVLKQKYGAWGYFDYFITHNIEQTEAELAGTKKRPVPVD